MWKRVKILRKDRTVEDDLVTKNQENEGWKWKKLRGQSGIMESC